MSPCLDFFHRRRILRARALTGYRVHTPRNARRPHTLQHAPSNRVLNQTCVSPRKATRPSWATRGPRVHGCRPTVCHCANETSCTLCFRVPIRVYAKRQCVCVSVCVCMCMYAPRVHNKHPPPPGNELRYAGTVV